MSYLRLLKSKSAKLKNQACDKPKKPRKPRKMHQPSFKNHKLYYIYIILYYFIYIFICYYYIYYILFVNTKIRIKDLIWPPICSKIEHMIAIKVAQLRERSFLITISTCWNILKESTWNSNTFKLISDSKEMRKYLTIP